MTCFRGIRGLTPPWAEWLHSVIVGLGNEGYEIVIEKIYDTTRICGVFLLECRDGRYHFKKGLKTRDVSWLLKRLKVSSSA